MVNQSDQLKIEDLLFPLALSGFPEEMSLDRLRKLRDDLLGVCADARKTAAQEERERCIQECMDGKWNTGSRARMSS